MPEPQEDKIAGELAKKLDAQAEITAQEAARTQSDLEQPSPNDDTTQATAGNPDKAGDASKDDATETIEEDEEKRTENTQYLATEESDNNKANEEDASKEAAEVEEQADPTQVNQETLTLDQELEKIFVNTQETIATVAKDLGAIESPSASTAKNALEEDLSETPTPTATRAG